MPSLYSDFRPLRTLNPDGYNANVSAWLKSLMSAASAGYICNASTPDSPSLLVLQLDNHLLRELETKTLGQPLALGTVVREGIQSKTLLDHSEFLRAEESVYLTPWRIPSVSAVLGWGLRQFGLGIGATGDDKLPAGRFVLMPNLEKAAGAFMEQSRDLTGRVQRCFSRADFEDRFAKVLGTRMSTDDMNVFLRYLDRDKQLILYTKDTVKIRKGADDKMTEEDLTISSLQTLIKDLYTQITTMEKRIDEINSMVKAAMAKKNRPSALAALRSRKLAESTLESRHATLSQLEQVMTRIEQAADQVELVRVMEASTHVLMGLNKEVGGVERVDNVVDQLREQITQVDEVGNVIAESGSGNIDESEIDAELEALEVEERKAVVTERDESAEMKRKFEALDALQAQAVESRRAEDAAAKARDSSVQESTDILKRLSLEPMANS